MFLRLENWTSLTEAHLQRKPLDDYQTQSNTIKQLNNRGYTGQPNSIQLHMEFPWNFLLPIMALAHFIHLISFDHEMPGRTLWQYSLDDCPKRVKFLEGNSQCERSDIKKNCMTIDNNWHPRDNWLTSMTHWHIDTFLLFFTSKVELWSWSEVRNRAPQLHRLEFSWIPLFISFRMFRMANLRKASVGSSLIPTFDKSKLIH